MQTQTKRDKEEREREKKKEERGRKLTKFKCIAKERQSRAIEREKKKG